MYDILAEWGAEVAGMYEACLIVLDCFDHDEKLALAAHAARETMSAVADAHGVTWDEERLHEQLNTLKRSFKRVPQDLLAGGQLPESIISDEGLVEFLGEFGDFAKWYGDEVGNRRKQAENLFRKLIPDQQPAVYQSLGDEWVEVHRFFSGVCHHGKEVSDEKFRDQMSVFENWIATTRLEAVEDLDAIDQLIEGGGADGHS